MDANIRAQNDKRDVNNVGAKIKRRRNSDRRPTHARQSPAHMAKRGANAIMSRMRRRRRLPGHARFVARHAQNRAVRPGQRMSRPRQPGKKNLQQHGVQAKDKKSGPPPRQCFAARLDHGADNPFRPRRVKQAFWRMAGMR